MKSEKNSAISLYSGKDKKKDWAWDIYLSSSCQWKQDIEKWTINAGSKVGREEIHILSETFSETLSHIK